MVVLIKKPAAPCSDHDFIKLLVSHYMEGAEKLTTSRQHRTPMEVLVLFLMQPMPFIFVFHLSGVTHEPDATWAAYLSASLVASTPRQIYKYVTRGHVQQSCFIRIIGTSTST